MILDRIDNIRYYQNLSPLIKQALDYIKNLKVTDLKPNKLNLGNGISVTTSVYLAKDASLIKFESHRTHLNLEYMVKGNEYIQLAHADALKVKEAYDPIKDIKFYHDHEAPTKLLIKEGYFIIYFPDDAHKVGIKVDDHEIYKVEIKIPIK